MCCSSSIKHLSQQERSQDALAVQPGLLRKSYYAAVGIFACALLTPYKPSLTTEKKPGSTFCVAKPPKQPLAAESYRGAVGISWVGLACHSRCPNLQAPPSWSKGPVASWIRRWASGFNPGDFQNIEAQILHCAGASYH